MVAFYHEYAPKSLMDSYSHTIIALLMSQGRVLVIIFWKLFLTTTSQILPRGPITRLMSE